VPDREPWLSHEKFLKNTFSDKNFPKFCNPITSESAFTLFFKILNCARMADNIYFISDVHLHSRHSAAETRKKTYLFDFLKEVQRHRGTLYIVGDLFDFWFEYRHVIPRYYFSVLRHLQETVEAGCNVQIITGNHDYWLGSFFPDELGIEVHFTPLATQINGKSFFITHADGILKEDKGYRLMKKVLRSSIVITLFRMIHPDLAFRIAQYVSGKSRHFTMRSPGQEKAEQQELIKYGQTKIQEGYQFVVTAHFHIPTEYENPAGKMINLGDWICHFTFGFFDGENLSLCYWNQNPLKKTL
jgi:UDP-2,3-diacylglucosamine hydrolase